MTDVFSIVPRLMNMLLQGDDENWNILREQWNGADIISTELSPVGMFVEFRVPSQIRRLPGEPKFHIGDVALRDKRMIRGMGFVLFIEAGCIAILEGYTYGDEKMPGDFSSSELFFTRAGPRYVSSFEG